MKRLAACLGILAATSFWQSALAADFPVKAPPPAVVSLLDWSGWYVGAHVGYGWGDTRWAFPTPPPVPIEYHMDGFLAGGQIGFNFQSGPWVLGIEADISWLNADGDVSIPVAVSFGSEAKWMATLTGRIGYASGPGLLYLKGGAAWMDEVHITRAPIPPFVLRQGETRTGWTVGVGYEYDFGNRWSAKLEYSYLDFGSESVLLPPSPLPVEIDQDMHVIKWGLNYRFTTGY